MTTTEFKTQLHGLIQLQRTAHTKAGVPDAATRRDRLTRAAAMLAGASDAIAVAVSEDFGLHWLSIISERTMSGFARCSIAPLRAA